jgi:thioredoxin-related protein
VSRALRLLAAAFAIAATPLCAEGIQWRSWDAALEEAALTQKIIMVDAVKDNCRYCMRMDENVFKDAQMAAYLEKRFIPVKINLSHSTMPMGIRVQVTPSFYFFTPHKKLIKTIQGSWNQEDFTDLLDNIRAD